MVEGRLVFTSSQHFKDYMNLISKKRTSKIDNLNKSIGFNSSYQHEKENLSARLSSWQQPQGNAKI